MEEYNVTLTRAGGKVYVHYTTSTGESAVKRFEKFGDSNLEPESADGRKILDLAREIMKDHPFSKQVRARIQIEEDKSHPYNNLDKSSR